MAEFFVRELQRNQIDSATIIEKVMLSFLPEKSAWSMFSVIAVLN